MSHRDSGSFATPKMKPGTYTVTLYQGELEAGTGSVSAHVVSDETPVLIKFTAHRLLFPQEKHLL